MTARPIVDGELLDADKINNYLNHTMLEPVPYTPTVNANAAVDATYMRVGRLVMVEFAIEFTGSATAGILTMTPPSPIPGPGLHGLGTAMAVDGGAGATRRSFTVVAAGNTVQFNVDNLATNAYVTNVVPWTWAAGDYIRGRFSYWAEA